MCSHRDQHRTHMNNNIVSLNVFCVDLRMLGFGFVLCCLGISYVGCLVVVAFLGFGSCDCRWYGCLSFVCFERFDLLAGY